MVVFVVTIVSLFTLDFINVIRNEKPPRFSIKTVTKDNMVIYDALFYQVYQINKNTPNEYYVVDTKSEYQEDTVPKSPFNRKRSGIENIIKYQNKYIGNNSNVGNLLNNLPLAEYGYVFEIDSNKLGLVVNYHITDWYRKEDLYIQKSLIYNSVSIFGLIENVEYITYNFTGSSYTITRKTLKDKFPHYFDIVKDNKIQKDKFNEVVEAKMNDDEWVERMYQELF